MPFGKNELLRFLEEFGIAYALYEHEPVFTAEEALKVCGHIPGVHCKNLFLKDKGGALWMRSGTSRCWRRFKVQIPVYIRPGLRIASGSKLTLMPAVIFISGAASGSKTSMRERRSGEPRTKVAWPPVELSAVRIACAPASFASGTDSQINPPPQS